MKYLLATLAIAFLGLICWVIYDQLVEDGIIFYEYKGVNITRVDNGNKSYFYYGSYNDGDYPKSYIRTEYSGFNMGMQGYLTFESDKRVFFRCADGYAEKIGNDSNLILVDDDAVSYLSWSDTALIEYKNTYEVSDVINLEKEGNIKSLSKVKADYSRYE